MISIGDETDLPFPMYSIYVIEKVNIFVSYSGCFCFTGRHRPHQACRRVVRGGSRQDRDHHAEPQAIQDPRLVPQQTEGHQGR